MGNGRGKIDCTYCTHFDGQHQHESARCRFHLALLPPSSQNRICCHFEASTLLAEEAGARILYAPVARQFAWFGADLEPGILYEYPYNDPPAVKRLAVLRQPDYESWGWKP